MFLRHWVACSLLLLLASCMCCPCTPCPPVGAAPPVVGAPARALAVDLAVRERNASAEVRERLRTLRGEIGEKSLTFEVSYTEALDHPTSAITGMRIPADIEAQVAAQQVEADAIVQAEGPPRTNVKVSPKDEAFNWVSQGAVTPVRHQGSCGSCWAFASAAVVESSNLIRFHRTTDLSEQHILLCSKPGDDCGGGWWAFPYMKTKGCADEAALPYTASDAGPCPTPPLPTRFFIKNWNFAHALRPTDDEIKKALVDHGPLSVCVYVDSHGFFQGYSSGVYSHHEVGPADAYINHAITLVGWDNAKGAWLIKNSWGKEWGVSASGAPWYVNRDGGFMWIKYGVSAIGYGAAWAEARN